MMAFSLADLAKELGIEETTLSSKPEVVSKWNGYLNEADTKYQSASRAQQEAESRLAQIESEQTAINEQIEKFGYTEATVTALRANNAAMEASLKAFKEQGFDVKLPDPINTTTPAAPKNQFDAEQFRGDVNASLVHGFNVMNKYQRLYGEAIPDDIDALAREATAARKPFAQYAAEKYDFAGQEKKLNEETQKKHDEEIRTAAIREYQEKHPVTQGNPELQRGAPSRYSQVARPREGQDLKTFGNLSARQKIAQSVGKTRAALENSTN
jgi:hypothetical protein